MRNYIILNNKKSDTISGLIIQELPAISKPAQRTQVETIDGRDGDIITPLGYAAYNKKIKIGLYGTFDINEIIAYFATQGQVIFSNEPNKYYNYQIVDQIDYERLVRYKVATVTMHVQPFKYSSTETPIIVDSSDTVSGEGSDIALANTAEAPFNTLRYKGNATQDGTPTPDNPIDIKVLTGDSTVKITGKNLIDVDNAAWVSANSTLTEDSGVFEMAAQSGKIARLTLPITKLVSGMTYVISFEVRATSVASSSANTYARLRELSNGGTWLGDSVSITVSDLFSKKTITYTPTTITEPYLWFYLSPSASNTNNVDIFVKNIQLEVGTATDYEPYIGQNYVLPFGDTYLAKIGTYQDYIWNDNGTWKIHKETAKYTFTGSESFSKSASLTKQGVFVCYTNNISPTPALSQSNGFYNKGQVALHSQTTDIYNNFFAYNQNTSHFLGVMTSVIPSWDDTLSDAQKVTLFKNYLANNENTIYYIVRSPTDTAITDQDLIDALDDFYNQAHAYKGHTHITAIPEGENAPAVLAVDVNEDNESTVTNAGNTTSRPILTIYGQGDIGVYINDVEVLDVALGDEEYITLDSVEMEAYKDTTANLKNRLVTGDYSKLALNAGANKIRFTGIVTKYEISKYSRWL